jgi:phenylphosphate carboxylase alpha subunit
MAFKDLRQYISALEENGEINRIEREVDWNLEAGAIMRLANERSLPAPFFQNIKGYPPGYAIFGSPLNTWRKLAIAMGLNPEISGRELVEVYLQRKDKLIKPIIVDKDKAPCKENIDIGDQINLTRFPAPMLHDGDGGRYIGTWHINISKDPDSGWVNWGMYRFMINNKKSLVGSWRPSKHMGFHFYRKYKPRKLPMPFAIVIGTEPISALIAGTRISPNTFEADVAGAVRQEPVELVKCETVDLEVPATSEIVIEGEVSPTEMEWEGPFGEFSGYSSAPREKFPLVKVTAVTYRNDPILTASCMGVPIDESHITAAATRSAEILGKLRGEGVAVSGVNIPLHGASFFIVVGIRARESGVPNLAARVADIIWGTEVGTSIPYVIVVDEDVDVWDMGQVVHALFTRCHPYRGIRRVEHATGIPHLTFLNRYERKNKLGAKALFDATWPLEWDPNDIPPKMSFESNFPAEIKDYVLQNWESYGYKKPS